METNRAETPFLTCDYAVVGAGLAGCTCAYLLQKAHKRVVLIDRADCLTKEKLCGGMLTPRSIDLARRLFGQDAEALYQTRATSMRVLAYVEQMELKDIQLNTLHRPELDRLALTRYLDQGGMLIDSARWKLIGKPQRPELEVSSPQGTLRVRYKQLIGADGANSQVRRTLVGPLTAQGRHPQLLPSLEGACTATGAPITIKYEPRLLGYSWYIPCGHQANIGCMASNARKDLKPYFDAFAQQMGTTPTQRRGAFIPSGSEVVLQGEGFYLLGDAAGLICPPSGEGIYYAMESAVQLAEALTQGGASYPERMQNHVADVRKQYLLKPLVLNQPLLTVASLVTGLARINKDDLLAFAFRNFVGFTGK